MHSQAVQPDHPQAQSFLACCCLSCALLSPVQHGEMSSHASFELMSIPGHAIGASTGQSSVCGPVLDT